MSTENEKLTDNSKLSYLNSLEISRKNETEISDKPKYFITFPYPYMNGKLHLGHLYSISKSDFMSYYKELQGYNVLFPLAFHCTGMPISALAKKLGEELNGQKTDISTKDIIMSLGFTDVTPFTDPVHWIKTFPKLCINSLQTFGANIDWRRSFITTDINKYYDSFIKWQFTQLRSRGYLSFGKRHSIYCPIDNQACLDHDRRKGENIKPMQQILYKIKSESKILLVRFKTHGKPMKLVCGKNFKGTVFNYKGQTYISEDVIYENLKYQVENVEFIKKCTVSDELEDLAFDGTPLNIEIVDHDLLVVKTETGKEITKYTEDIAKLQKLEEQQLLKNTTVDNLAKSVEKLDINENDLFIQTDKFVSVYIPEDEVISRSGGICVVSLLDQWYIDYANVDWKNRVKQCLKNMECEQDTRSKLADGIDWLYKWGFSRSFGLGTRIPWDPQYLIDSLSDSTIYMAFYTVKHYLFSDLEGFKEIFPSEKLSNDVWDYIFYGKEIPIELSDYTDILKNCRESFTYFYPVDLRVSGKDLIKNHLLFFMFNHVALFDEKYWPRRIFTNGHLMLNSEKMSKSTGNFLTVDEALLRYGTSATRMCLAVCGDTNEDANFVESNANSFILKIYNFVKNIEDLPENMTKEDIIPQSPSKADIFLLETLSFNIRECIKAFDLMKYSDVVKYGFFEMNHLINLYKVLKGSNTALIRLVLKSATQLLYPIIPTLSRSLIEKFFNSEFNLPEPIYATDNMICALEYLKDLSKKIFTNKSAKNKSKALISCGNQYSDWKIEIMKYVDSLDIKRNEEVRKDKELVSKLISATAPIIKEYNINVKKGNLFLMDYVVYPEKYSKKFDEYELIQEFKFYVEENSGKTVIVSDNGSAEPLNPIITYE